MSRAYLVAGLGFGDEGKGTITQYLAEKHESKLVVRYNGGAQAAHNVYSKNGKHHTFAQFGSGTLEGRHTHLSRYMMVEPHALFNEGKHLEDLGIFEPYKKLTIDERALLITPYHWSANRLREIKRGTKGHGTCGLGIGETMEYFIKNGADAPTIGDLRSPDELVRKLKRLSDQYMEELVKPSIGDVSLPDVAHRAMQRLMDPIGRVVESYAGMLNILQVVDGDYLTNELKNADRPVIFEGAQGVLLDQNCGFHPHTTWSDTTFLNALELLAEAGIDAVDITTVGVIRTYLTRHGRGPLPTEIFRDEKFDKHNSGGLWQGEFRIGYFDFPLLNYAARVLGGVDEVALTHCDQIDRFDRICHSYRIVPETRDFFNANNTLKMSHLAGLNYQEQLTNALNKYNEPVYMAAPTSAGYFADAIRAEIDAPVTIFSSGPGPADKTSTPP